jgi:hypothetical protein
MRRAGLAAMALAAGLAAAAPAEASVRLFSYDPADSVTRRAAGALTFEFNQGIIRTRVRRISATLGQASAPLREADDGDLGARLETLIGDTAGERDLYEVMAQDQGAAMIRAFCPGASRAWLAMGRLRANAPLRVHVLGAPQNGPARVCVTLNFEFRGEWRGFRPRDEVPQNALRTPRFPY